MQVVVYFIILAVGMALGLAAGFVIRVPEAVTDPSILLPRSAPDPCLTVIAAGEEMSEVTRDYLALAEDTYLPLIGQAYGDGGSGGGSVGASGAAVVGELAEAESRLADVSQRAAEATARFNEAKVGCERELP